MKHSIRKQFSVIFILIMLATVLMTIAMNILFLRNFHVQIKQRDIINAYFSDWFEHKDLILDDGYNLYAHYLQSYIRHSGYSFNPRKGKPIYIVHYVGVEKPWMVNTLGQFVRMCRRMFPNLYYVMAYFRFRKILRKVRHDSN